MRMRLKEWLFQKLDALIDRIIDRVVKRIYKRGGKWHY